MIQLRIHQWELTYQVALSPPVAALIDEPGRLASALVSQLEHFDLGLSDVSVDDGDGSLDDKGLSCELEFDASILLRADRFEIHFLSMEATEDEKATELIRGTWQVLNSISPQINATSHSLLFEIDCEVPGSSYVRTLEQFCRPHENLPKGTETAVVYYLPHHGSQGFLDSSIVLNRSDEVEGGVLLAATFVFEGKRFGPEKIIDAGQERLKDLLSRLGVNLSRTE
jgi:hypothetical protein